MAIPSATSSPPKKKKGKKPTTPPGMAAGTGTTYTPPRADVRLTLSAAQQSGLAQVTSRQQRSETVKSQQDEDQRKLRRQHEKEKARIKKQVEKSIFTKKQFKLLRPEGDYQKYLAYVAERRNVPVPMLEQQAERRTFQHPALTERIQQLSQPIISRPQFVKLYGGYGDYDAYVAHVAKARGASVGQIIEYAEEGIAPERLRLLRKSEKVKSARIIARLERVLEQGGQSLGIPVEMDISGDLMAMGPQARKRMAKLIEMATSFLGTAYDFGSASGRSIYRNPAAARAEGFDCSGFVEYLYDAVYGIDLSSSNSTHTQQNSGRAVGRGEKMLPGDLVFFGSPIHHVGLYIGDGYFMEAPYSGEVVRITRLNERSDLTRVRRIIEGGL